jgi:hypothetical protein
MSDVQFAQVLEQALQLTPDEQARLVEQLRNSASQLEDSTFSIPNDPADEPWKPGEIEEMLKADPHPPAEVAARGLLGKWADHGITDGAEWVNEQKRKRQERLNAKW